MGPVGLEPTTRGLKVASDASVTVATNRWSRLLRVEVSLSVVGRGLVSPGLATRLATRKDAGTTCCERRRLEVARRLRCIWGTQGPED